MKPVLIFAVCLSLSATAETSRADALSDLLKDGASSPSANQAPAAPEVVQQPATVVETPAVQEPQPTQPANKISVACEGTIDRRGVIAKMQPESFTFRTVIDLDAKKHTVVNVIQGALFRSGREYAISGPVFDVITLQAESTKSLWKIDALKLDLALETVSGTGSVQGGDSSRLSERSAKLGRLVSKLAENAKVIVTGKCQATG